MDYFWRFNNVKDRCLNLSISKRDLASLALGGLCPHFKEKLEGYDYFSIAELQLRALIQERKFKEVEESFKTHQSNARVNCESNTSNDEKENNSDMDNNLVMLRIESNKDFLILLYNKKQVQLYKIIANPIK